MGIDVDWVRVKTFIFVGIGAAFAGIFSTLINLTWWSTAGEGYFFAGARLGICWRHAYLGGVGTVAGGAIGALIFGAYSTPVTVPNARWPQLALSCLFRLATGQYLLADRLDLGGSAVSAAWSKTNRHAPLSSERLCLRQLATSVGSGM